MIRWSFAVLVAFLFLAIPSAPKPVAVRGVVVHGVVWNLVGMFWTGLLCR